eukprot:1227658-Ditylum_brightwellii.AAC.1
MKGVSPQKKQRTGTLPRQQKLYESSANSILNSTDFQLPAAAGNFSNNASAVSHGTTSVLSVKDKIDSNSLSVVSTAGAAAIALDPAPTNDTIGVQTVKTRKRYYPSSKSSKDAYDAIYGPKISRTCLSCNRVFPSVSCLVYHLSTSC